jgi:hypothetical protein
VQTDTISSIPVLYDGKTTLGYEVSVAEARELNKHCQHLFTAYHKDARKKKTPWILSTDLGVGKQQLHGKWANILFRRPPPRRKKYLP